MVAKIAPPVGEMNYSADVRENNINKRFVIGARSACTRLWRVPTGLIGIKGGIHTHEQHKPHFTNFGG